MRLSWLNAGEASPTMLPCKEGRAPRAMHEWTLQKTAHVDRKFI